MRLINVKTFKLEEFLDYKAPPYAILSHTWGNECEELSLLDVQEGGVDKLGVGSVKFRGSCRQAKEDGLGYVWLDTCCIDRANSVELSEAINSMYRWYKRASICYAYLSDVPSAANPRKPGSEFWTSRWFRRGWTLQELLAPEHLRFYNSEWHSLGTKGSMWAALGKITGIPRQFLLGITELYTASVAQRMSWAAQRDTKRQEDLAYCLLGIFGVTMPMIYGEGGDQAFFRLQEHIMKTTRDDSILAWGLSVKEQPLRDSGKATAGRILAAAPSDFANSGQIVPREQSTTSLNSLDISGGSLRIHLSLLTTSTNQVIGLLSCGPEHDTQQVIGIPLAMVTSGSPDVYARPRGCHSVLQPLTTLSAPPKLIYIKNDSQIRKSTDANQQYWLYDDDEFGEVNLELVDVAPRSWWHQERAMIISTIASSDSASHLTLVRLRHNEEGSRDFVIVLELTQQGTCTEAQCCVMICSRNTSLEELAGKLRYVMQKASGKRSASNGLLHLHVTLERDVLQPMFTIKPEKLPHPLDVTVDATLELHKSDLVLDLVQTLEAKKQNDAETEDLDQMAKDKSNRLEQVKKERETVEDKIRRLEEKRRMLVEEEENGPQEIRHLTERLANAKEKQEHASKRWSHAQKRWHELWGADGDEDKCSQTPLIWAAANGCEAVTQLLLNTDKVDANLKDDNGRTPLSWAAEKGHETIVQMLLEKGADVNIEDKDTRTAFSYATGGGHEVIVQLLLGNRVWQPGHILGDYNGRISLAAFSSDLKLFAFALSDNTIRLLDTATGQQLPAIESHSDHFLIALSPDSKLLALIVHNQPARLWDTTTGQLRHTFGDYIGYFSLVFFSPDSRLLAFVSDDGIIRLWDTAKCQLQETLERYNGPIYAVTFSPDSKLLAFVSDNGIIRLWDTAKCQLQQALKGHNGPIYAVTFSPDSKLLAFVSGDGIIRLWDTAKCQLQQALEGDNGFIDAITFSPDSKLLASVSRDGIIGLWDTAKWRLQQALEGDNGFIDAITFSPDSKQLASVSHDGIIRLWDTVKCQLQQTLKGHNGPIYAVAFSPDSKLLASASFDKTVRFWVTATGT